MVRAGITAFVLALALTASAPAAPAPNVRGTVAGGAAVACPPGEPCDPPLTGVYVLFTRSGAAPVRIRVVGGTFALHLAPGAHAIRLLPPSGVRPAIVRVPRTGVVRLRLVVQPNP